MSSTRRAADDSPLNPERFASSPEYGRGVHANLVAKRCSLLERAGDRELLWWIQERSLQLGGIEKFARELMLQFPQRVATAAMQRIGFKEGRIYSRSQVLAVRAEFPPQLHESFLIGDECTKAEMAEARRTFSGGASELLDPQVYDEDLSDKSTARAENRPNSIPARNFADACAVSAREHLPEQLQCLCLDPALNPAACAPWYFPTLVDTLREWRGAQIEEVRKLTVVTEVGQSVFDALDYASAERCMVLIEGNERIGKTFSAKAWCAMHTGGARYFQVPATTDDISFFRAIAASLGVSINLNSKAHHLRDRIEQVLQTGQLMLVADEAHYLWPQSRYREALPQRINWLLTALVNYGVPVALVCTPQFFEEQRALKRRVAWRDGQFIGRLGHFAKLPETVCRFDLRAVAKRLMPEGDSIALDLLVAYALTSARYLAGIETAVKRARFLARREGKETATAALVARAIEESAMPSDERLAASLAEPPAGRRQRRGSVPAAPLQARGTSHPGNTLVATNREPLASSRPAREVSPPALTGNG